MESLPPPTIVEPDSLAPERPRGHAVLAWIVIMLVGGGWFGLNVWPAAEADDEVHVVAEPAGPEALPLEFVLTGKILHAAATWFDSAGGATDDANDALMRNAEPFDTGSLHQRLAYVLLAGVIEGPEEARERLDLLRETAQDGATPGDPGASHELFEITERLVDAWGGEDIEASVSAADRERLLDELGFFGRLGLAESGALPADEAAAIDAGSQRLMIALIAFGGWVCFFGFVGFVIGLVMLIRALLGTQRGRMGPVTGRGAIYAETFAVWLILFFSPQFGARMLAAQGGVDTSLSLAISIGIFFVSLLALGWPVLRGVPWRTVRQDVGLTLGRPFIEPFAGLATYAMALPILAIGLLLTAGLMALREQFVSDGAGPGHPVQEMLMNADAVTVLLVLGVASFAAPIVEETMFRGVLFRHLREATSGTGRIVSFVLSAVISSVLFAAIHPQGWTFIPVLASLAVAFCIGREWRGSLVPSILAHAVSNAVIVGLNVALFGG